MDSSAPSHDPNASVPLAAFAQRPAPPPRRSWGCMIVPLLLGCGALALVVLALAIGEFAVESQSKLEEKFHSRSKNGTHKIAILKIEGVILDGAGYPKKQIDAIRDDKSVKAVILRVDSPGGTVNGSDYIYHHLRELRQDRELPIVVSMGALAASGGYYVAMAAGDAPDIIYAEPTTWTGSIGVIIPHYNVSGLAKRFDVQDDSIKSHPLKGMGSPLEEMTEQEREIFKGLVDDGFDRFKEIVRSGRANFQKDPAALDKVATGQVFTTRQAIANGLVDKEGFIEAAIDRAIDLSGVDKDDVKVIEYKQPFSLFGGLLTSESRSSFDAQTLLELLEPKAYYLWSWPQQVAVSQPALLP